MRRRVAVTGIGLVSCLGHDYDGVVQALMAGRSGVIAMPQWGERGLPSLIAGAIVGLEDASKDVRIPKALLAGMSDAARYCSVAAARAVASAGLSEEDLGAPTTACIVGSGVGSVRSVYQSGALYAADKFRRMDPFTVLKGMSSSCSAAVANLLGIRGRSYSISSACATGAHNIGHAFELIRSGVIDRAVVGGGEDVDELITASFAVLRVALSRRYNDRPAAASRPFDAGRDGFVISGGAGILVLEELTAAQRRGAVIRAEIRGFGTSSDGFDPVLPRPDGEQAATCMRLALADAGRAAAEVDYVNAHATSTMQGDLAEAQALRLVFGDRMPLISSTKSMTGHALGAAGALELIFCIGMLERGFLAPSINIDTIDPAMADLPVIRETVARRPGVILSNSFGFGGTNACLVLESFGG
jgi:3-oxoacyl-[acyl-carrier-protein] synthase-1